MACRQGRQYRWSPSWWCRCSCRFNDISAQYLNWKRSRLRAFPYCLFLWLLCSKLYWHSGCCSEDTLELSRALFYLSWYRRFSWKILHSAHLCLHVHLFCGESLHSSIFLPGRKSCSHWWSDETMLTWPFGRPLPSTIRSTSRHCCFPCPVVLLCSLVCLCILRSSRNLFFPSEEIWLLQTFSPFAEEEVGSHWSSRMSFFNLSLCQ